MNTKKRSVKRKGDAPILYASPASAGFPAPGDDMVETRLSLDALLIKNPPATFFVRASGDSMEGVHIASGDILVVDRSIEPRSGMVAVAAVMGELVVKRLVKRGKVLLLVSENDAYEPIVVTEEGDCVIWGVVTGVVRTLL